MAVECMPCAVGYHAECWRPNYKSATTWVAGVNLIECCCSLDTIATFDGGLTDGPEPEVKEHGGQLKKAKDIKDLESTGRKRAAILYPIPKEGEPGYPMACEWRGLAYAGGGVLPIIGCSEGMAKAIHHGPNKSTVENSVGNVHRICAECHNRWHTLNDPHYPSVRPAGNEPYLPSSVESLKHDGVTQASPDDRAANYAAWALKNAREFYEDRVKSAFS